MKRLALLLLPIAFLASGCAMKARTTPGAPVEFANADYTVLGNTNGEACGTYILGIDFGHLLSNQAASYSAPVASPLPFSLPWGNKETRRALYDALGRMPEATHILAPKVHSEFSGLGFLRFPIFGKRCSTVDARGVTVGAGPVPNAH